MDARATKAVWPSVDEAALARAFQNRESQNLALSNCKLQLNGSRAHVICQGKARFVRKIGRKAEQQPQRQWLFTLSQGAGAWKIDSVKTR